MARWRAAAIERLPEFRPVIQAADSVMALWIELSPALELAYRPPVNESLIRRIYNFARWCEQAPRGPDAAHDPVSTVHVAFFEHLPTKTAVRADMPRWFRYEEVAEAKQTFSYLLEEDEYQALLDYMAANRDRYGAPHVLEAPRPMARLRKPRHAK